MQRLRDDILAELVGPSRNDAAGNAANPAIDRERNEKRVARQ